MNNIVGCLGSAGRYGCVIRHCAPCHGEPRLSATTKREGSSRIMDRGRVFRPGLILLRIHSSRCWNAFPSLSR